MTKINNIRPTITRMMIEDMRRSAQEAMGPTEDVYLHLTPDHIQEAMNVLLEMSVVVVCPCRGCGKPIVIKDLRHFDPDSHYCGESPRCKP